jgi:hypothetical protein
MQLKIQRIVRWTLGVIFAAFAIFVAVLAYPFVVNGISFESHRFEMMSLVQTADPAYRPLPQPVHDLLLFSLRGNTSSAAARLLIREFDAWPTDKGGAAWTIAYATWSSLVALHLSEQDRLAIIARLAPTGGGHFGLKQTADALFDRPLSDLTLEEAGLLIVLTRGPGLYDAPQRLSSERDRFLSRYEQQRDAMSLRDSSRR